MSNVRNLPPELFNPRGTRVKQPIDPKKVQLIIVDLFCGAGGFTIGAEMATDEQGNRLAVVIAGVNHDKLAIESHAVNHPETTHFIEDVRDDLLPLRILKIVNAARKKYPYALVLLHASMECTNFSNAKGGKSRDPDSRSLADHMPMYLRVLKPDYFTIENVREFMDWGPMRPKEGVTPEGYLFSYLEPIYDGPKSSRTTIGFQPWWVPIREEKGREYERWTDEIKAFGYTYTHRIDNSANFGANTSRKRLYGIFAREGVPVQWPEHTHAKNPVPTLTGRTLQKWRPIRECLQLEDKGTSIFGRKTPLAEKSLERIFEGLVRHVGNGSKEFLAKYFTGEGMTYNADQPGATITAVDHQALVQVEPFMVQRNGDNPESRTFSVESPARTLSSTGGNQEVVTPEPFMMQVRAANSLGHNTYKADRPARTITTQDGHAVITPEAFAMTYHSGSPEHRVKSLDDPAQTLTTENRIALAFCYKYHGNGENLFGTDAPCSSVTCKDRVALVRAEQFVALQYGEGKQEQSVHDPASGITCNPKHRLVSAEFIDQQFGQSKPASADSPAGAITVNPHFALVQAEGFVLSPQWFGMSRGIDVPHRTIIARQDKSPESLVSPVWIHSNMHANSGTSVEAPGPTLLTGNHHYVMQAQFENIGKGLEETHPTITADRHWSYLMTAESGPVAAIIVYPGDSPAMRKIKAFMAEFGIVDILMRMLKVQELKLIQGFPADYYLAGSQTHQKKFIGNSVTPAYSRALITSLALAIRENRKQRSKAA